MSGSDEDQSGMTAMADLPVPWRRCMIIAGGALAAAHLPLLFHEAEISGSLISRTCSSSRPLRRCTRF